MTKRPSHIIIPACTALVAIAVFWIVSFTLSSVIVFIPGVIISFLFYLTTYYRTTPGPEKILPIYLLALGIQFIHFTEEYLTDFVEAVPNLLGQEAYPLDYWIVFNMVAYTVFILGGIILFNRIKALMIIPLFFMLVGVLLNSVGHILIALYVGGYFPGLYTALIYIIIGPILIKRVFNATKIVPEII